MLNKGIIIQGEIIGAKPQDDHKLLGTHPDKRNIPRILITSNATIAKRTGMMCVIAISVRTANSVENVDMFIKIVT